MKRVKSMVDENDDDKFYKFHDDVLRHIINLLPTKDAVRTSVLSSRWKTLYRCISNIDIDDAITNPFEDHMRCPIGARQIAHSRSIERLLIHHECSDIKRFSATAPGPRSISRWIPELIKRNVEQLFFISVDNLSLHVFRSESLTVLELVAIPKSDRSIILISPEDSSVHLPSLKRLKLSSVEFKDNHSAQNLFSNIPNLQQLCLYRCDWKNVDRLIIDIPTLERIDVCIRCTGYYEGPMRSCQVKVMAPKLTSLNCDTDFSINFHLSSNHSLAPLNVLLKTSFRKSQNARFWPEDFPEDVDKHLPLTFLQGIREATSVHMQWDLETDKWLRDKRVSVEDLPLFTNLEHLEISMHHSVRDVALGRVFMFLHKMPFIESFTINLADSVICDIHEHCSKGGVPSCVINQIKNLSIITSDPLSDIPTCRELVFLSAMDLIMYFMDHSRILETVEINWLCSSRPEADILDEIEKHPRYSELKRFSCPPCIAPRPPSMPFP